MRSLFLILIISGTAWNTAFSAEPGLKTDKYAETAVQELRFSPEKYWFKCVSLKVKFIAFKTNFPRHAIDSGLKSDNYLWLNVAPSPLLVFMPKKGADLELKRNSSITIYGKVLKFTSIRLREATYYLMVERIDAEDKPDEESAGKGAKKAGSPETGQT
jgi:hypothetical protein